MAVTYELLETFSGTRTERMPDPDNAGETLLTTSSGVRDILVKFTLDTDANVTSERNVNVCFASDGAYDAAATAARIVEVGLGIENKLKIGGSI